MKIVDFLKKNININLNVKDIINIDELNDLFLKLEIESGDINLSDSYVMWKDDLIVNLNESLISYDQGEIFLTGRINVDIKDINDFFSPNETLLVADSLTGQDAANIAKSFSNTVNITGSILTRIDGDGRGGAALSIMSISGGPI